MKPQLSISGYPCLSLVLFLTCATCNTKTEPPDRFPGPRVRAADEMIRIQFPDKIDYRTITGKLSQIASDIEFVPLETTSDCLLNDRIFITPSENGYFVKMAYIVYRFSLEGKFLGRINTDGNGPGEHKCASFFVNDGNRTIVSRGFYNDAFFFSDLSGTVLRSVRYQLKPTQYHGLNRLIHLTDSTFVATYGNSDGQTEILYSIRDYEGKVLSEEPNPHRLQKHYQPKDISIYMGSNDGFYHFNGALYSLNVPADTIYKINPGGTRQVHALIGSGGLGLTKEEDVRISAYDLDLELIKKRRKIIDAGESDRYLFLLQYSFGQMMLAIYDKADGSFTPNYNNKFVDDLTGMDSVRISGSNVYGNYLYCLVNAFDFIHYFNGHGKDSDFSRNIKTNAVMNVISENSNPVLLKIRLKNFSN